MKDSTDDKMIYFISDHHGVYVPKVFSSTADRDFFELDGKPVPAELWEKLEIDPYGEDSSELWDVWMYTFLDQVYAVYKGHKWSLFQDGDLWLLRDDMTSEEMEERFLI